ncbi:MAG: hypothetical protein H8F28_16530 [Fibrella sp.]|nr:hypothetical protein [Armatimonadota bacterium]
MSLRLQLTPETEARFRTLADAKGLPVAEYVSRFLETAETTGIEGDLARQIQNAVPADLQRRFNRLYAKRRRAPETLTENEYAELLRLTDEIEAHDTERAHRIVRLAALRNVSVETVVAQLGLKPVAHD